MDLILPLVPSSESSRMSHQPSQFSAPYFGHQGNFGRFGRGRGLGGGRLPIQDQVFFKHGHDALHCYHRFDHTYTGEVSNFFIQQSASSSSMQVQLPPASTWPSHRQLHHSGPPASSQGKPQMVFTSGPQPPSFSVPSNVAPVTYVVNSAAPSTVSLSWFADSGVTHHVTVESVSVNGKQVSNIFLL